MTSLANYLLLISLASCDAYKSRSNSTRVQPPVVIQEWHDGYFEIIELINGVKHGASFMLSFVPFDTKHFSLACNFVLKNRSGILFHFNQRAPHIYNRVIVMNSLLSKQPGQKPGWLKEARQEQPLSMEFGVINKMTITANVEEGKFYINMAEKTAEDRARRRFFYSPLVQYSMNILNLPEVTKQSQMAFDKSHASFKKVARLDCFGVDLLALSVVQTKV